MTYMMLTFEQPVSELIRAGLRLEYLFQQALSNLKDSSIWASRSVVAALVDILNILDRPDLKTKLTKELSRHLAILNRLEHLPNIDKQKLGAILLELESLVDLLHATNGKFGQELRENEFLNPIRQHLATPGGTSGFDTPAYLLWLQQPASERIATLAHWLKGFDSVHAAVSLLLQLTRQSCPPQSKTSVAGFYQTTLDPQAPCQLVRVAIPRELNIYPEISVGRHGISIRFYPLNLDERKPPIKEEFSFQLTTCIM